MSKNKYKTGNIIIEEDKTQVTRYLITDVDNEKRLIQAKRLPENQITYFAFKDLEEENPYRKYYIKDLSKSIFAVKVCTSLTTDKGWPNLGAERLIGYYFDIEHALYSVQNNLCDIWEHTYDYAIVEEVEEGLYNTTHNRFFFKFNQEKDEYELLPEEPEGYEHFQGLAFN